MRSRLFNDLLQSVVSSHLLSVPPVLPVLQVSTVLSVPSVLPVPPVLPAVPWPRVQELPRSPRYSRGRPALPDPGDPGGPPATAGVLSEQPRVHPGSYSGLGAAHLPGSSSRLTARRRGNSESCGGADTSNTRTFSLLDLSGGGANTSVTTFSAVSVSRGIQPVPCPGRVW